MKNNQAVALLRALLDTETLGGDHDGNPYEQELNAHFISALRVAFPDLPTVHQVRPGVDVTNVNSGYHSNGAEIIRQRNRLGDMLIEFGNALKTEVPIEAF